MKSLLIKTVPLAVLCLAFFAACSTNPDFKEIDRGMDDISRRIGRMETVANRMEGKEIETYKQTFLWNTDEFETSMKRLAQELDDVKKSENDREYSADQIYDFRELIQRLKGDCDRLNAVADEALKLMNISGIRAMETETGNFIAEIVKFREELSRISDLAGQLKSDKPLRKPDEFVMPVKPVPADSSKVKKDTTKVGLKQLPTAKDSTKKR